MEHNKFDYINDIIRPIKYFFRINGILTTWKKKILSELEVNNMKRDGYIDKRALKIFQLHGATSNSYYFNNYQQEFVPQLP